MPNQSSLRPFSNVFISLRNQLSPTVTPPGCDSCGHASRTLKGRRPLKGNVVLFVRYGVYALPAALGPDV